MSMWNRLEDAIACNFPQLWRVQAHWALASSALGILLCLLYYGASALLVPSEYRLILLIVPSGFQTIVAMVWFFRIRSDLPRLGNIVEHANSPLAVTIVLFICAILAGPIFLIVLNRDSLSEVVTQGIPLVVAELLIFVIGSRYLATGGPLLRKSGARSLIVSVLSLTLIATLVITLRIGPKAIFVGFFLFLLIGTFRICFCFRVGRCLALDLVWFEVGLALPMIFAFVVLALSMKEAPQTLPILGSLETWKLFDHTSDSLFVGGLLVSLPLWVDSLCFVLARFSMLPMRNQ
jgi:hypothetical protein